MKTPIRIKATSALGGVAYIHRSIDGAFSCVLANGIPASLSYAGIHTDEMACRFALDDCSTGEEALAIVRQRGASNYIYDLLTPPGPSITTALAALSALEAEVQRLKALFPQVAEQIDARPVDLARAALEGQSDHLQLAARPEQALFLRLFHGRREPAENPEDWGSDGPVIGPLAFVHTTYLRDVKFAAAPEVMDRFFPAVMANWRARKLSNALGPLCDWQFTSVDDLLEYDGVYYGDWTVFLADPAEIETQTAAPSRDG